MNIITFLQQFDPPWFVFLMKMITMLGDEIFYVLVLPLLLWCWRKELSHPLILLLYSTFLLNTLLKTAFGQPRPPEAVWMVAADNFGFPSGHAQVAMVLWGYLAHTTKRYWGFGVLIFLIGFSRIYLGVHFPQDVVGGWTIGLAILATGILIQRQIEKDQLTVPALPAALVYIWVGLTIAILSPDPTVIKLSGFIAGLGAGVTMEQSIGNISIPALWWKWIMRGILGIAGALLVRIALKVLFPDFPVFDWIRYGVTGIWIGWGAPWVFGKLKI